MIFGLINKDSGPGYHRIHMPLVSMKGVDAYITNHITPEDFATKKPTAIYYNRAVSDDVILHARAVGCKIVVDVDDYWLLDPHHIAYQHYKDNFFESLQIKHLHLADLVTTTHARLAEKIYPYNKNVVILPNAIPASFTAERTQAERTRIFWQGSITHEKDIELLRNPVKRLDKQSFAMILAGYTQHPAWDKMVAAYTNGLQMPGMVLPGSGPESYYQHYQHADICVAPLLDTCFNSMKSNLKVLEAAHLGLPVIASKVNPYLNMPGLCYVEKQSDWYKWLMTLTDASEREARGKELQDYCRRTYDYIMINLKRKQCLTS